MAAAHDRYVNYFGWAALHGGFSMFGDDQVSYNQSPVKRKPTTITGKCESCGARDFVTHNDKQVCSYCRSDK